MYHHIKHPTKMKNWTYLLIFTIIACTNSQQNANRPDTLDSNPITTETDNEYSSDKEICWTGTLSDKTPIFIHYQLDSNLIIGELTFLNTKDKLPIKLIGTIQENLNYDLLLFDETGNITDVLNGLPTIENFNGTWHSLKKDKEYTFTLLLSDTSITSPEIKPIDNQIFGNYHYQYGEDGYNGDFEINKIVNNKVEFYIHSETDRERGPNMADVEKDTIAMQGNSFVYMIPDTDCEFKATFYKDFVYINYTKGSGWGVFGMNATIEGIYLKTNNHLSTEKTVPANVSCSIFFKGDDYTDEETGKTSKGTVEEHDEFRKKNTCTYCYDSQMFHHLTLNGTGKQLSIIVQSEDRILFKKENFDLVDNLTFTNKDFSFDQGGKNSIVIKQNETIIYNGVVYSEACM